jgi:hypothetical protein
MASMERGSCRMREFLPGKARGRSVVFHPCAKNAQGWGTELCGVRSWTSDAKVLAFGSKSAQNRGKRGSNWPSLFTMWLWGALYQVFYIQ